MHIDPSTIEGFSDPDLRTGWLGMARSSLMTLMEEEPSLAPLRTDCTTALLKDLNALNIRTTSITIVSLDNTFAGIRLLHPAVFRRVARGATQAMRNAVHSRLDAALLAALPLLSNSAANREPVPAFEAASLAIGKAYAAALAKQHPDVFSDNDGSALHLPVTNIIDVYVALETVNSPHASTVWNILHRIRKGNFPYGWTQATREVPSTFISIVQ